MLKGLETLFRVTSVTSGRRVPRTVTLRRSTGFMPLLQLCSYTRACLVKTKEVFEGPEVGEGGEFAMYTDPSFLPAVGVRQAFEGGSSGAGGCAARQRRSPSYHTARGDGS